MSVSPESKRERRLAARAERMRMAEEGRRRSAQRRRLALFLGLVALVAVLAIGAYLFSQSMVRPSLGVAVPDEGREHVAAGTPIQYQSVPPASGTHFPTWTRPGVYAEQQPDGNWVHSLEHGYVVVLYDCDGAPCPELQSQLREFYEAAPKSRRYNYQKLVVQPYSGLDSRIVALAWNRKFELQEFDRQQLLAFYEAYVDRGPEDAG